MKWRDILWNTKAWHKPETKNTRGIAREQNLPLSNAAINLLKSLPGYQSHQPDNIVFPNAAGGRLGPVDKHLEAMTVAAKCPWAA